MPKAPRSSRQRVAFRNQNHNGVWIASYVQRCQLDGEDLSNPRRRCLAWKNTIILKARNREEAYRKAVKVGRRGSHTYRTAAGRRARWIFEGVVEILPVYGDLSDGSELFFRSYNRSVASIKAMVLGKRALAVFNDAN